MSLRHIRKYYGDDRLQILRAEDGEDFEPAYAEKLSKSLYEGLVVSSNSDGEVDNDSDKEVSKSSDVPETSNGQNGKKKKNKRKKKGRKSTNEEAKAFEELDEIDRSVKEVNALLGEPEVLPEPSAPIDTKDQKSKLFTVRQKFFAYDSELTRKFGPDEDEQPKKRGRQPNLRLITHKGFIIKTDKIFKKNGLSMELVKRENDTIYFAFVHNKAYQRFHSVFIETQQPPENLWMLEEAQSRMHVEGLLETANQLYYMERYAAGNEIIEDIISYMQQCSHPHFSVTDIRVRLLYKHVENRAFHIALLKYMHMLTNKACHRTALEIAKVLLNLDPSDPLAVLFMIDTIAIRAGEYEWLIDAVAYWSQERDAGFLFNIMYSLALAEFHVSKRNQEDDEDLDVLMIKSRLVRSKWDILHQFAERNVNAAPRARVSFRHLYNEGVGCEKADRLLTSAMLQYPSVAVEMMKIAGIKNEKITSCPLFTSVKSEGSFNLNKLIALYARFIWHKFLEESVMQWFIRNATALVDEYNNDHLLQMTVVSFSVRRKALFQTYPPEILRHLSIITPLSNLIVDGAVPDVGILSSFDPAPPSDGINRYARQPNAPGSSSVLEFFTSMMPDHELMDAPLDQREDLPRDQGQDVPALAPVIEPFETESEDESEDDSEFETPVNIPTALETNVNTVQQNLEPPIPVPTAGTITNTSQDSAQPPTVIDLTADDEDDDVRRPFFYFRGGRNVQGLSNQQRQGFAVVARESNPDNFDNTSQDSAQPPTVIDLTADDDDVRRPFFYFRGGRNVQGLSNQQRQGSVVVARELNPDNFDDSDDVFLTFETVIYKPRNTQPGTSTGYQYIAVVTGEPVWLHNESEEDQWTDIDSDDDEQEDDDMGSDNDDKPGN